MRYFQHHYCPRAGLELFQSKFRRRELCELLCRAAHHVDHVPGVEGGQAHKHRAAERDGFGNRRVRGGKRKRAGKWLEIKAVARVDLVVLTGAPHRVEAVQAYVYNLPPS